MSKLKNALKRLGVVKKYRAEKWKKIARSELFSKEQVEALENNPALIQDALKKHLLTLPDGGSNTIHELEKVFQESAISKRPDLDEKQVKDDMLFWHFAYGFTFREYVGYQFPDKDRDERLTFFSDRDSACLCYDINDLEKGRTLADKTATYKYYKNYFGREAVTLSQESDYDIFCEFAGKHSRFVKKVALESCGRSVELINLSDYPGSLRDLFTEFLSQGKIILEEVVIQNEKLAVFNRSSVNTVRCITFNTKDGVVAPFTFMKAGRSGYFVDNGSAGGILISVDPETGILGMATDENGYRYSEHPDSKVQFCGYQLPEWKKMINICCEMSSQLPEVRIIGWDMAYTDKGWIVIEGNSMTESIGPQSTTLRGIRRTIEELRANI